MKLILAMTVVVGVAIAGTDSRGATLKSGVGLGSSWVLKQKHDNFDNSTKCTLQARDASGHMIEYFVTGGREFVSVKFPENAITSEYKLDQEAPQDVPVPSDGTMIDLAGQGFAVIPISLLRNAKRLTVRNLDRTYSFSLVGLRDRAAKWRSAGCAA